MIPKKFIPDSNGDYIGLNMSKTNSQEEENKKINNYNDEILRECGIREDIIKGFDSWKGMCWLAKEKGLLSYNKNIKEFGGWGTSEILDWLVKYSSEKDKKENVEKEIEIQNIKRVITKKMRYKILKRQGWRCNNCGVKLKYSKESSWEGEVAQIDHIFPFAKRKDYPNSAKNINEDCNLQALCPPCNREKRDKLQ